MARSRNIKPGFFTNEYLAELSFEARLLFIGLWTIADRRGRLEDRPKGIKGKLLPYDNINCDALLQELADSEEKFIIRYTANGKQYIQITNFEKHQFPNKNEAESVIPAPFLEKYNTSTVQEQNLNSTSTASIPLNLYTSTPLNLYTDCPELPSDDGTPSRNQNDEFDSRNPERPEWAEPQPDVAAIHQPIITLTLNDKSEYPIYEEQRQEWAGLYPAVDVMQQLRSMRGWCIANPNNRKTKNGIMKFVNGWLSREQNKPGQGALPSQTQGATAPAAKQNRFVNFTQRDIDYAELERLELEQLKANYKDN